MSSNLRNQRLSALRPVRNRQEEQFKKDLKELEELQKLNHDMNVIEEMMKFKISNTESTILQSFNDTAELIAFKGTALIQHVAQEKIRNEERNRPREQEINQPRHQERNEHREEESNHQREEENRNPWNLSEQERSQIQIIINVLESRDENLSTQPQHVEVGIQAFQSQQKPQMEERFPQRVPTQSQSAHSRVHNERAPDGRKILKAFEKYEPQLYKQLLANNTLQEKVLVQTNVFVDEARTMILTLLLNLRSKDERGRSRAFGELCNKHMIGKQTTQRTSSMFEWPFVEIVSMQLREKNLAQQRRKQSENRGQELQREERRQGNKKEEERRQGTSREQRRQGNSEQENIQSNQREQRNLNNQRDERIHVAQRENELESDSDSEEYYEVVSIGCNIY